MTSERPLILMREVVKRFGGLRPLRIASLALNDSDRVVLGGLDESAAEAFVHLVSGASLPDEGSVSIDGTDTRAIATDTDWLASLDRFGIVTHRAVFVEALPVAANVALPLTLSIDPMPRDVADRVAELAAIVGLPPHRMQQSVGALPPADRLRIHLARALANRPRMLLLEHPTAPLTAREESGDFAAALDAAAAASDVGFVALSEDQHFARASAGRRLRVDRASGAVRDDRGWRLWRS